RKVIGFIGDSTFFHAGLPALASAVHNNHDLTLVILDNGTTAMTGHQPHPGAEMAAKGLPLTYIPIEGAVKGLGVKHVSIVNPMKLKQMQQAIKEAADFKGVSVVISRALCPMLALPKEKKKKKRSFYVNENKCKNHRDCLNLLGCPAFFVEDGKVKIDETICTGCALCTQICSENAILPKK
ncbi:MAG: thiamine pyrophosphate-dependent enzyme, partial [Thermodesulfobacteriota bacterium]|nr:thiamine pyrophosphate-dependent enzyme [Thermodesulfobacteriota bacterium]